MCIGFSSFKDVYYNENLEMLGIVGWDEVLQFLSKIRVTNSNFHPIPQNLGKEIMVTIRLPNVRSIIWIFDHFNIFSVLKIFFLLNKIHSYLDIVVHTFKTLLTEVAKSNCRKTGVKIDQLEKFCDMLENDMSLKFRNSWIWKQ